jgi:pyruvate formate lyase activating enzyme
VSELNIAGWVKFSTVDWPDQIVSTLFLQGCPWRCEYCHNFSILDPKVQGTVDFKEVLDYLANRNELLDGVVFSGGEPLMQPQIVKAARRVKDLGFGVGLHTGGAYPQIFATLLPYLDWVGLDIKAPWEKYDLVTGRKNSAQPVQTTLQLLLDSKIGYQVRTTFDRTILTPADIETINAQLQAMNARPTVVQEIRTLGTSQTFQARYRKDRFLN